MNKKPPSALVISAVKDIGTVDGAAVRLTVEAAIDGNPSLVEISITTDLAAQVAIALLATTERERSQRDGMSPALAPLAIGVVASGDAEKVRLQMLFEKPTVLPVELPKPAAMALAAALQVELAPIDPPPKSRKIL